MTPEFARAQILRTHHRYEEAVALLYQHLAHDPEDPDAFIELALNRTAISGAEKLALADARTACGLAPDRPFPLSLQARILSSMNAPQEALRLAEAAISLEPSLAYYWNTKSIVLCDMGMWKSAEDAARQALALEPDDGTASNLLSLALRRQNKIYASEEESRRRLKRDPESAFPFYNLGLAALRRNQFKDAEGYFLESLRLDPTLQHVRQGLKETLQKIRFPFRGLLGWTRFFSDALMRRRARMVTISVFFSGVLALWLWFIPWFVSGPGAALFYLTLFSPWLHRPLSGVPLLLTLQGRSLMEEAEMQESTWLLRIFGSGFILLTTGLALHSTAVISLACGLWLGTVPWSLFFYNRSRTGRWVFGIMGSAIFLFSMAEAATQVWSWRDRDGQPLDFLWIALALFTLVIAVWLEKTRLYSVNHPSS